MERFRLREIRPEEAEQTAVIEEICFPPNEACSRKHMLERVGAMPEMFTVAEDRETGKLAGFVNGLATGDPVFRDEFFTDPALHQPEGTYVMILGLDVLPEYRRQGLATALMASFLQKAAREGRKEAVLTCHGGKIGMYEHMGFRDCGMSGSVWGGVPWHEMRCSLPVKEPDGR